MCSFVRRRITIPQPSNQSTAAAAVVQVQAAPVTPLPVFKGLIPRVLQVPVPAPAIVAPVPSVRLSVPNFCNTQAAIASGPPAAEVAVRAAETHVAVVDSWEGWSTNPRAIQAWILGITEKTTLRLDRHGRTEDYEIRPRHGHLVVDYISRKTFNGRAVTKKIEIGSINICRMKFFYSINSRDLHQGFQVVAQRNNARHAPAKCNGFVRRITGGGEEEGDPGAQAGGSQGRPALRPRDRRLPHRRLGTHPGGGACHSRLPAHPARTGSGPGRIAEQCRL